MKMIKRLMTCEQKKIVWIILIVMVISLIPILYLSGYVHASGDDYGYGARAHKTWLETGSLWQTLKGAGITTCIYYNAWQGTWFTIFLMALQPEVFFPNGYWIVPWVMLGITIVSTSLLTHYFIVKKLELGMDVWGCTNSLLMLSMIQFYPKTKSAIFWYNGTIHYIVPYCLALLAIYGMFRFSDTRKTRYLLLCCITMFCLGGSSYLAPLLTLIILFYLLLFMGKDKKYLFWLVIPAIIEMVGLVISFLAPGNKVRGGEDFGFSLEKVITTILQCFEAGINDFVLYMRSYPLIIFAFLLIAMFIAEGFMRNSRQNRFPMPLLFFVMMFCAYCAMYAPGIYSGADVSGGVPNTIFQVLLLTLFADIVYGIGWISSKLKVKWGAPDETKIRIGFLPILCIAIAVVLLNKGTLKDSTAYEGYDYIVSGRAADYKEQMDERLAILLDESQKDVVLPAMNPDQGPLMHMEIMEDPEAWTNTVAKQFFRKDRIVQMPREEYYEKYGN